MRNHSASAAPASGTSISCSTASLVFIRRRRSRNAASARRRSDVGAAPQTLMINDQQDAASAVSLFLCLASTPPPGRSARILPLLRGLLPRRFRFQAGMDHIIFIHFSIIYQSNKLELNNITNIVEPLSKASAYKEFSVVILYWILGIFTLRYKITWNLEMRLSEV